MPETLPAHGDVRLRPFNDGDAAMLVDMSTDPYVPLTGTLPFQATHDEVLAYIRRQHGRLHTGYGYSFCIADARTDEPLGQTGLWLASIDQGRATAGYCVAPRSRGRGLAGQALRALTSFAWTIEDLYRVELYIEPWNAASVRTAEGAGYVREGCLRSHQWIGERRVDMLLYAAVSGA
ncbi:GNAT family N-acetyltransferase [Amycolatopsis thermophila]|uniref:RimJ/RimL family protein N-acetyltransferase n=1 Tax=Amycolatopsis thermophila TaxID=206084 RepID=A0ABU0EQN6_9PSEU|nr:GNAT family protein [Amycolatopsis thermophila]MDQ0377606.1 RimJ/RimL family protein N-acetyltransferase [Amycolatopsis thermophila]